jgi:hypothetical protein
MNNGSITLQPGVTLWSDAATHSYNRKQQRLTPSQYSVFQELRAEYLSLDTTVGHSRAQALADAIIEQDRAGQRLSYDDIRALETALVRLEPGPRTRERLRAMRRDYTQLTGGTEDLTGQIPSDDSELKARVEQLLSEFHTIATNSGRNQELCARLFRIVSVSTIATVVCVAALGTFCWLQLGNNPKGALGWRIVWALPYLPAVFYSMAAGTLGAYFSSVLRVQNLAAKQLMPAPMVESVSFLSAAIAPVVGAFAGFLVFAIFASGLVTGEFLPKIDFRNNLDQLNSGLYGITQAVPVDKISNIKLLLAGLVSGFSERFFPDVLDWLSKGMSPLGYKKKLESRAVKTSSGE